MQRRIAHNFTRSLLVVLAILTVLVLAPPLTRAQITPSGDSYTNSADPTTNYGAKTLLDVDGATRITYIQFPLSSVPSGASLSQATLKLYVNAVTTAGSFNVDYVNGTWSEGTITYNNAPALGTTIASNVSITTADKNQYILIDVTPAVQAWLDGSQANDGIALVANSTFNASFDSKENTGTSHPAELDLVVAGNIFMGNETVDGNLSATGVVTGSGFQIGSNPFAYGSYVNGNALLGFAGNTTMTSLYNTASGVSALFSNTTGYANTASGYQALFSNTTGMWNVATGSSALFSNTSGCCNAADGTGALTDNTTGIYNTASGQFALNANTTGSYNTADGASALESNTTANNNTASGYYALEANTTGYANTAVGSEALNGNTTGNDLTCIGYGCSASDDALSNATAIGAHARVGQSNSLVLGGTDKWAVKVGIGTEKPSNILTIGRGLGHPVSDSWETYSSRRWKTNIQTLNGALDKVEQLRGVSYDLKDSGKHEIGVIAEEVGAVVPEVVSYEKNGTDAAGVDYGRLTALLIEATKEQQKLIKQQQREITRLRSQVKSIQAALKDVSPDSPEVRSVKAQLAHQ